MKRASLFALCFTLVACGGGGGGSPTVDAGCADPEVDPAVPAIACPDDIDLGCIGPEGAALDYDIASLTCGGDEPTVVCDTASGATVMAGTTRVTCTATNAGLTAMCGFDVVATLDGMPSLTCVEPDDVECDGATTLAPLPEPERVEACGAMLGEITDDAPAGFALGETLVTFTGMGASCTSTLRVVDTQAPTITCGAAETLVRASASDAIPSLVPEASDACDDALSVVGAPDITGGGAFSIEFTATDASGNSAACTQDVTILDVFAPIQLRVMSATLNGTGGTDVTLAWDVGGGADTTHHRIERAGSAAGPYTELASLGLGNFTFTDVDMPGTEAHYRVVAVSDTFDGGVSNTVRALAITADRYDLRGESVPSVPFATTLYGIVRRPQDMGAGPFPLVLMLHGNHGICRRTPTSIDDSCARSNDHECPISGRLTTPNAEGMAYMAETLAAQGYVAVSISGNAMNCRTDYVAERTQLLLEHLRRWAGWASSSGAPFGSTFVGGVAMDRVALVGHSRGGDAVSNVPEALVATPISGVTVGSIFALAPTDFNEARPSGTPYMVLLPGCDGDVRTLEGMDIYDRVLDPRDAVARAQVLFPRANHNYFNTEWRSDDNDGAVCRAADSLEPPVQRAMLEGVLSTWLSGTVGGAELESYLRAETASPQSVDVWAAEDLDLRFSYSAAERTAITSFEHSGSPAMNLLGEVNAASDYTLTSRCNFTDCDRFFPHVKDAFLLSWDLGAPMMSFGLGGFDATDHRAIGFRVVSRRSSLNASITAQDFVVRLTDEAGTSVAFALTELGRGVPHLYPARDPFEILMTSRLTFAQVLAAEPSFDVSNLSLLELEMTLGGHDVGSVLITDIDLSRD